MPGFKGRHVAHIGDLTVDEMTHVLDVAERYAPVAKGEHPPLDIARGRVLATLFFEPSTRTRLSFESAMARLGGATISVAGGTATSAAKGESLADTTRVVASYADAIVLRHPHEGAARLAARYAEKPVVNAGDGAGQHPTQTLLDLFTIRRETGRIEGNHVVIAGDLKYGRTVHSLADALARFGAEMTFVAPDALQLPRDARDHLDALGAKYRVTDKLDDAVATADVVYATRIQRERFPDPEEYARVRDVYQITKDLVAKGKKGLIVMHPLPRVNEIRSDVDATPAAKYFEQAANGVPVRMALLALVLGLVE